MCVYTNVYGCVCRSAIYANRLYLSLLSSSHPRLLAGNDDSVKPHIVGLVRIHPTALVDPTATVSGGRKE